MTAGPAWLALAGCLLGVFMQMLDTTIVNIALPRPDGRPRGVDLAATSRADGLHVVVRVHAAHRGDPPRTVRASALVPDRDDRLHRHLDVVRHGNGSGDAHRVPRCAGHQRGADVRTDTGLDRRPVHQGTPRLVFGIYGAVAGSRRDPGSRRRWTARARRRRRMGGLAHHLLRQPAARGGRRLRAGVASTPPPTSTPIPTGPTSSG